MRSSRHAAKRAPAPAATGAAPRLKANALSLRIPEPRARPGQMLDFGNLRLSPAGEAPRPPIDVEARDIRDLAYALIRVLDDRAARSVRGRRTSRRRR